MGSRRTLAFRLAAFAGGLVGSGVGPVVFVGRLAAPLGFPAETVEAEDGWLLGFKELMVFCFRAGGNDLGFDPSTACDPKNSEILDIGGFLIQLRDLRFVDRLTDQLARLDDLRDAFEPTRPMQ